MDRRAWWTIVHGAARVGHNLVTEQHSVEILTQLNLAIPCN